MFLLACNIYIGKVCFCWLAIFLLERCVLLACNISIGKVCFCWLVIFLLERYVFVGLYFYLSCNKLCQNKDFLDFFNQMFVFCYRYE